MWKRCRPKRELGCLHVCLPRGCLSWLIFVRIRCCSHQHLQSTASHLAWQQAGLMQKQNKEPLNSTRRKEARGLALKTKQIARAEISSLFRGRCRGIDQRKLDKKTSSIRAESEPERWAEPTVHSRIHSNSSKQFLPALRFN